jgi:hypothetical protein
MLTFVSLIHQNSIAQNFVKVEAIFQNEPLELGKSYFFNTEKDCVKIEILKFYLSDFSLWNNKVLVFKSTQLPVLIDLKKPESKILPLELPNNLTFNTIKFNLGIDSLTNVSGAFGGDLDPTNGMYWTWQSGYINFKIEGTSSISPARKNIFQYHLGGYLAPYYGLREIKLPVSNPETIHIILNLSSFFEYVASKEIYQVMSPNQKAMYVADEIAKLFSVQL